MTEVIQAIISGLTSGISLLGNLVAGIMQMLWMIPVGLTTLMYSIESLPTVLVGFAAALITISVTYLIIGR